MNGVIFGERLRIAIDKKEFFALFKKWSVNLSLNLIICKFI